MVLRRRNRAQYTIRDGLFRHFPALLDGIEFWAVRRKIEQAKRLAMPAAKPPDSFAPMPGCVVDEKNKPWITLEKHFDKANERSLRLTRDETECERALCSRSNNVKALACVAGFHDGATAPERPALREVGRDVD